MRFGLLVMATSLSASVLSTNVSAAPLQLMCEFKRSGYKTNLILSISDNSSNSSGSVEYESGVTINGQVTVTSKFYTFEGEDEDMRVRVSVNRDDGSASIFNTLGSSTFSMEDPECSKYEGRKF